LCCGHTQGACLYLHLIIVVILTFAYLCICEVHDFHKLHSSIIRDTIHLPFAISTFACLFLHIHFIFYVSSIFSFFNLGHQIPSCLHTFFFTLHMSKASHPSALTTSDTDLMLKLFYVFPMSSCPLTSIFPDQRSRLLRVPFHIFEYLRKLKVLLHVVYVFFWGFFILKLAFNSLHILNNVYYGVSHEFRVANRPDFVWIVQKLPPLSRKRRRIFLDSTICVHKRRSGKFAHQCTIKAIDQKCRSSKLATLPDELFEIYLL